MCHGTIKNTFSASASTLPNVTQKMPTKAASSLNFIAVSKYHSHKSRQEVPKYYRHCTQTWGQYFLNLLEDYQSWYHSTKCQYSIPKLTRWIWKLRCTHEYVLGFMNKKISTFIKIFVLGSLDTLNHWHITFQAHSFQLQHFTIYNTYVDNW